jgi:hypothetical protein
MILLPINYGFFCAICVRVLVLQPGVESTNMVASVLSTAEIWEAWALWSVLALFVLVADTAARRDERRRDDVAYLQTLTAFKGMSLQGVKVFFSILASCALLEVFVEGLLNTHAPTWCYWFLGSCTTCSDWYHVHIYPAAQAVTYILCCFALMFVFMFERVFDEYLRTIQPYWKFWGVKGVVTVTYFQWLFIKFGLGFREEDVYKWHCVACCIEMPLLAIVHTTVAYPYGKPWLASLLDHVPRGSGDAQEAELMDQPAGADDAPDAEAIRAGQMELREPNAVAVSCDGLASQELLSAGSTQSPRRPVNMQKAETWCSLLVFVTFWVAMCYGAVRMIWSYNPPENDLKKSGPLYIRTCTSQDLTSLIHSKNEDTLPARAV